MAIEQELDSLLSQLKAYSARMQPIKAEAVDALKAIIQSLTPLCDGIISATGNTHVGTSQCISALSVAISNLKIAKRLLGDTTSNIIDDMRGYSPIGDAIDGLQEQIQRNSALADWGVSSPVIKGKSIGGSAVAAITSSGSGSMIEVSAEILHLIYKLEKDEENISTILTALAETKILGSENSSSDLSMFQAKFDELISSMDIFDKYMKRFARFVRDAYSRYHLVQAEAILKAMSIPK